MDEASEIPHYPSKSIKKEITMRFNQTNSKRSMWRKQHNNRRCTGLCSLMEDSV